MTVWAIASRRADSLYGVCIPWTCGYTRKQAWGLFVEWRGFKDAKNFRAIKVLITGGDDAPR